MNHQNRSLARRRTAPSHLWLGSILCRAIMIAAEAATVALAVPAPGVAAALAEPTEQEMREAVQARVDEVNAKLRSYEPRCSSDERRGNVALAVICAVLVEPNRGQVLSIEKFAKKSCEAATEAPGFVCEYVLHLSLHKPAFTNSFGLRPDGSAIGRFARQDGRWVQTLK